MPFQLVVILSLLYMDSKPFDHSLSYQVIFIIFICILFSKMRSLWFCQFFEIFFEIFAFLSNKHAVAVNMRLQTLIFLRYHTQLTSAHQTMFSLSFPKRRSKKICLGQGSNSIHYCSYESNTPLTLSLSSRYPGNKLVTKPLTRLPCPYPSVTHWLLWLLTDFLFQ